MAGVVRSQNGFTANDRSLIAKYQINETVWMTFRKGDVATVMVWAFKQWDKYVEPLVVPGCWGYAERLIRGSSTIVSNHASGTAGDGNAPKHPLGVGTAKTFSPGQINAIRNKIIKAAYVDGHPVLRWGGDYNGRPDAMHIEIIGTPDQVRKLAYRIKFPPRVTIVDGGPTGKFPLPKGHYYAPKERRAEVHSGYYAKDRPAVRRIQKEIGVSVDGEFGTKTLFAVKAWQKKYKLTSDGLVGPATWAAMAKH